MSLGISNFSHSRHQLPPPSPLPPTRRRVPQPNLPLPQSHSSIMPPIPDHSIRVTADRGGTFCDVLASWPSDEPGSVGGRKEIVVKLRGFPLARATFFTRTDPSSSVWTVSQDPSNYKDAPVEGVRRVLEIATGDKYPRGEKLKTDKLGAQLSLFCSSCAPPDIALAILTIRVRPTIYDSRYKRSS